MRFLSLKEIEIIKLPLNDRYKTSCREAGMVTLYDLLCYDKTSFENLKGCGRKGAVDLENIRVNTFLKLDVRDKEVVVKGLLLNPYFPIIRILSSAQLEKLEDYFHLCVNMSGNKMLKARLSKVSCKDYVSAYHWGRYKILRGVEVMSSELDELRQKCEEFINNMFVYVPPIDKRKDVVLESDLMDNCSLLYKLQDFIKHGMDRMERNNRIFLSTYHIFESFPHMSIKELSQCEMITYERVRGIVNAAFERVFVNPIELLNKFVQYDWSEYIRRLKKNREYLTAEMIQQEVTAINNEENCEFTADFMLYWLSCLLSDDYTLFNGYKLRKYNMHAYLINNELLKVFDVDGCERELSRIIDENKMIYVIDLPNFIKRELMSCTRDGWELYQDAIVNIIEDKMFSYFGILVDPYGRAKIPRGKNVTVLDVLYEIIKENGAPIHIDELYKLFKHEWPEHYYDSSEKLRAYMLKDPRIVGLGNTSRYALREWSNINIKTIRENVYDFLKDKAVPQALDRIQKYLEDLGRPTSRRSLQTSMGMCCKFKLYEGMLWGLSGVEYPEKYRLKERVEEKIPKRDIRRSK